MHLSTGIAAALHYDHPADPAAQELQRMIRERGVEGALEGVCGIDPAGELAELVRRAYDLNDRENR
ncbi:MAG: hypothetical protein ACR2NN_26600 [Bryobacteraceae bacterium]